MAFKAVAAEKLSEKTFWREVVVYLPNEAGTQTRADFDAHYRPLPKDEERAAMERLKNDQDYELQWFTDHVIGFRRVEDDETGQSLPFEEAFNRVYQFGPARQATIRAYHAAMTGQKGNG